MTNKAAQSLGRLAKGVKKHYSPDELTIRTQRLLDARQGHFSVKSSSRSTLGPGEGITTKSGIPILCAPAAGNSIDDAQVPTPTTTVEESDMKKVPVTNADVDAAIKACHDENACFLRGCRELRFKARAKHPGIIAYCGPGCDHPTIFDAVKANTVANVALIAVLYIGKPTQELPALCAQVPMFSTIKNPDFPRIGSFEELTALVGKYDVPSKYLKDVSEKLKVDGLQVFIEGGALPMKERLKGSL